MQQSNAYIVFYTIVFCAILGGLLAFVSLTLKEEQDRQVELDTRKQILGAVIDTKGMTKEQLSSIYEKRIKAIVVDSKGEVLPDDPKTISVLAEYKLNNPEKMRLPVYKFMSESNPDEVEAFIIPMYGRGLWDLIWGYLALDKDLNTIKGVVMDHKGETPGLGARIASAEVQNRYKQKKILDASNNVVGVIMLKGENKEGRVLNEHEVDGMSGATITGNGVNEMLLKYAKLYESYFNNERSKITVPQPTTPKPLNSDSVSVSSLSFR